MKGLTIAKVGAPYELATDLEKPTPGPKQVLLKSIYVGINPVYDLHLS
jgi:NADPH:quinone reductase-like Zn-dependent oxidoreductase